MSSVPPCIMPYVILVLNTSHLGQESARGWSTAACYRIAINFFVPPVPHSLRRCALALSDTD
jgi:hypothetical protein